MYFRFSELLQAGLGTQWGISGIVIAIGKGVMPLGVGRVLISRTLAFEQVDRPLSL